MGNYKLLCLDLDGTLLTSKRRMSRRTKDAIAEAERRGAAVVVTTGRPLFDAEIRARELHDWGYIIASNGAAIAKIHDGETLLSRPFTESEVDCLSELIRAAKLEATWFTAQAVYTRGAKVSRLYRMIERADGKLLKGKVLPDTALDHATVHKCNLFFLDGNDERLVFEKLRADGRFELVFTGHRCAEITVKGVTKASGISLLAETTGFAPEEIIAVGDSENDLHMIEYAGLGVAMGNAIPALKNAADWITGSNDEDGIADVIERFILNA
jgi:Cof subfamily protein (haloacid dehalogenase superfamily)